MFAVVQHDQQRSAPQLIDEGLAAAGRGTGIQPQGLGDGVRDQQRLADGGEVDEPDPVRVLMTDLLRGRQRQPGLPGAAGAGERQQPGPTDQPFDVDQFTFASDEAGQRVREVAARWCVGRVVLVGTLLGRRPGQQLAEQRGRLRVRVGPVRVEQVVDQPLVPGQRLGSPAGVGEHLHLLPDGSLVQRVGLERPGQDDEGLLGGAVLDRGRQLHQDLPVGFLELVPPGGEPLGVGEVGQQVAVVLVGRCSEAGFVGGFERLGGGSFEVGDVDVDRPGVVQHDLLAGSAAARWPWRPRPASVRRATYRV